MDDLTWVTRTAVVEEGDPAHQAMLDNPGWRLLHITGGLHGPVLYVHGWPAPHEHQWGDWEGGTVRERSCTAPGCDATQDWRLSVSQTTDRTRHGY